MPKPGTTLYRVGARVGLHFTTNPRRSFDLVVRWDDNESFGPRQELAGFAERVPVINLAADDCSKIRISQTFDEVFGYPLSLDPSMHVGVCVEKSNTNATHDGRLVTCPTAARPGLAYQVYVDTTRDGLLHEARVPIMGGVIPFVYAKTKPLGATFDGGARALEVRMLAPLELFSPDEVAKMFEYVKQLGVDFGEMDVLRDSSTGRIYVVDVNPTPFGPPAATAAEDTARFLARLCAEFEAYLVRLGV